MSFARYIKKNIILFPLRGALGAKLTASFVSIEKTHILFTIKSHSDSTPPPPTAEGGTYFEYHSQLLLLSSLKRQLEDLKGGEFFAYFISKSRST